ncbi:class I SAM-dependent methyltransferase [Pedobacter sp. SD-b]|uniref:Class I SAM-dependent methyltransferase n=1 Tax=Pedobacter segetis TaxID=2793069 RepID=A0ABS1BJJ8_9SPHI|nr:class I SAM-dependent methyltransferase [Pedobacter segetis]MBK0383041.1 class I SAM-dependent methyltransferase [Pedobacter segetis]
MIKNLLRKFIEKRGYIIYKKPVFFDDKNAFDYNSSTNTDKFYISKTNLKKYLNKSRIAAFGEIIALAKKNIDKNPLKVLDAGCGCGFLTTLIKENFKDAEVMGIDYSEVGIRYAKEKFNNIVFKQKDLYEALDCKFDLIFCSSVLEHLKFPELIITNLTQALNHGGKIIITVPNGRIDFFEGHIHFWSPESWELFLNKTLPNNSHKLQLLKSKPDILTIIS